jgi:hypothetical protein
MKYVYEYPEFNQGYSRVCDKLSSSKIYKNSISQYVELLNLLNQIYAIGFTTDIDKFKQTLSTLETKIKSYTSLSGDEEITEKFQYLVSAINLESETILNNIKSAFQIAIKQHSNIEPFFTFYKSYSTLRITTFMEFLNRFVNKNISQIYRLIDYNWITEKYVEKLKQLSDTLYESILGF